MIELKRFMVGLDFSAVDNTVIKYASFLCELLNPEKVYFVHVEKSFDIPDELKEKFNELTQPVDEYVKGELEKKIKENFNQKWDYSLDILEGDPFHKLLHWQQVKEIDFAIFGEKKNKQGTGIIAHKLARKVTCPVAFIPDGSEPEISSILVPNNFSKHSKLAMQNAVSIAKKTKAKIISQNVYKVPTGYYTTGKSYEEFAKIMKEHAEEASKEFIEEFKKDYADITPTFTLSEDADPVNEIMKVAEKNNVDLIIIGSKGRSDSAAVLLWSVAENLVKNEKDIPLIIIKMKDENLSFIQALLRL